MSNIFYSCLGGEIDLDKRYEEHLADPDRETIDHSACMKELGYALYYMKYSHPQVDWGDQLARVHDLCLVCETMRDLQGSIGPVEAEARIEVEKEWDRIWFDFHFKIQDEIENMC